MSAIWTFLDKPVLSLANLLMSGLVPRMETKGARLAKQFPLGLLKETNMDWKH
jgi:hypothetical protein